ncbi:hypothetical protein CLV58_12565 [Spirosoma oryzae]|uniref:Uncharacterized protein n=1 Tax=Spirosoma oryzae TaxID=1469603 RepID=A0A2T0S910_9BACT|nr:hypothetical protein [Spirosoma oryzae]PRY29803.1 hypothetical protein CLV58_12565 [Spirosoma oryzae]
MLQPTLCLQPTSDATPALRITDTTPNYDALRFRSGFGGANPARDAVRVAISILSALDNQPRLAETTLPGDIFTGDKSYDLAYQFADGSYQLVVSAYGTSGIPVMLYDYVISAIAYPEGGRLEVMRDQVWVDVTNVSLIQNGAIRWSAPSSASSWTLWRLLNADGSTATSGVIVPVNPVPSPVLTTSSGDERLISRMVYPLLLDGRLRYKIATAATGLSREYTQPDSTHNQARQASWARLYYAWQALVLRADCESPQVIEATLARLHRQADRLLSTVPCPLN